MPDTTTLDPTTQLPLAVANVAQLRAVHAEAAQRLTEAKAAWEREHQWLVDLVQSTKADVLDAEARCRELAVASYEQTGSKQPCPGVGIRVQTRLTYAPDAALAWAKHHDMALTLDVKTFETLAKTTCLPCVQYGQVVQATLAKEL